MTTVFSVCQNSSCNAVGSAHLVRDIEELASGKFQVEECGCLGKCGKGPNIEVTIDGNPVIHIGINTWDKALALVQEQGEWTAPKKLAKFGRVKYEARRMTDAPTRRTSIQDCIKSVGGEAKAEKAEPKMLAELLVMRSRDILLSQPVFALKDAELAVKLLPHWAQGFLALAGALDATHSPTAAGQACTRALEIGGCIGKAQAKRLAKRLDKRAQEEAAEPQKFKALRDSQSSSAIVKQTAAITPMNAPLVSGKVFVRFGGRKKFEELAHEVHEALFVHPKTKDFFPPTMDNSRITKRNVDFLVGAFGGPKYVGPDMVVVHEFLRITNEQYDVMIECYEKALEHMQAAEPIVEAILKQLEGMRYAIVYRKDRPNPNARADPRYLALHKAKTKNLKNVKTKLEQQSSEPAKIKSQEDHATSKAKPDQQSSEPAKKKSQEDHASRADAKVAPKPVTRKSLSGKQKEAEAKSESGPDLMANSAMPAPEELSSKGASACPYLALMSIGPDDSRLLPLLDAAPHEIPHASRVSLLSRSPIMSL